MDKHKYLHLEHESDSIFCNPQRTLVGMALGISLIATPAYLIGHFQGLKDGEQIGINNCQIAIDQSIQTGMPFTFWKGDVVLVKTIRWDSKNHKRAQQRADESFTYYRAKQILAGTEEDI